jgi:hypothetical protein
MRGLRTPEIIANELRMLKTQHSGSFLLVEGTSDRKFFSPYVDANNCKVIITEGKEKSLATIAILNASGFQGALAVVDTDYDQLMNNLALPPNAVRTDTHDIETMLLASPALDKLMTELGSVEKLGGRPVRSLLLTSGTPLGYLRWLSANSGLSLRFEDLAVERFVDRRTLSLHRRDMVTAVKNNSRQHSLIEEAILADLESLAVGGHDPWHVCCGHDLICLLSLGLRSLFGSCNAVDVRPEVLEQNLRLAFEQAQFSTTGLFQTIRQWEKANQPYRILR